MSLGLGCDAGRGRGLVRWVDSMVGGELVAGGSGEDVGESGDDAARA